MTFGLASHYSYSLSKGETQKLGALHTVEETIFRKDCPINNCTSDQ